MQLPGPPPLAPSAAAGTLAAGEARWKGVRKSPLGGGGGSGASSQAACLKQILLLQLDLIEQQQQQLQAKEKEIEELKSERDTVREGLSSVRAAGAVRMLGEGAPGRPGSPRLGLRAAASAGAVSSVLRPGQPGHRLAGSEGRAKGQEPGGGRLLALQGLI